MTENIGKITLDLTKYPGQDFYCDGAVEDEILEIAKNYSPVEYNRIIEERKNWPVLYHLSALRENIVDFIPMTKKDKVLEVGSGCGAITGALARKAGTVTCVDLSKKRSSINAYRHMDADNVTIHVGNFKDVEPTLPCDYDYICLIGVFEYGQSYIGGKTPYEDFLKILMRHLAPNGRIVIAIENKYGLKYFAGCMEDHVGKYFEGIENYPQGGGVRTFSRKKLEKIFAACGVKESHFYYPYPDYKFPMSIFSDKRKPLKGELSDNIRNFDRDRMLLFEEKEAFDGIVEEDLFEVFSNSYVAVIGEDLPISFAKYSNDRASKYQIKTVMEPNEKGEVVVRKYPMNKDAFEHIRGIGASYEKLLQRYEGGKLSINECKVVEEEEEVYAEFTFVKGKLLSELMDECLENHDLEGFKSYFDSFVERVSYGEESKVADYDLIFANIIVDGDTWTVIDYEWTFEEQIPTKELVFRALYCYLLEDEKRAACEPDLLLESLGITPEDGEKYREKESKFQKYVTGKRLAMGEIRNLIGNKITSPYAYLDKMQAEGNVYALQIYEDCGKGYSEEDSYFVADAYKESQVAEFSIEVSGNVRMLRIDPALTSCMCKIQEMTFNGVAVPFGKKGIMIPNGKVAKSEAPTIVFPTMDPNINLDLTQLNREAKNILYAKMDVTAIPLQMAEDMARAVKKLI